MWVWNGAEYVPSWQMWFSANWAPLTQTVLAAITIAFVVVQLLIMRRQTRIMAEQRALQATQNELAKRQLEIAGMQANLAQEQDKIIHEQLLRRAVLEMRLGGPAKWPRFRKVTITASVHNSGTKTADGAYWHLLVPTACANTIESGAVCAGNVSIAGTQCAYYKGNLAGPVFPGADLNIADVICTIPNPGEHIFHYRLVAEDGIVPSPTGYAALPIVFPPEACTL
jgi:hypothetical protein